MENLVGASLLKFIDFMGNKHPRLTVLCKIIQEFKTITGYNATIIKPYWETHYKKNKYNTKFRLLKILS